MIFIASISLEYGGDRIVSPGRLFPSAHPANLFSFIETGERKVCSEGVTIMFVWDAKTQESGFTHWDH